MGGPLPGAEASAGGAGFLELIDLEIAGLQEDMNSSQQDAKAGAHMSSELYEAASQWMGSKAPVDPAGDDAKLRDLVMFSQQEVQPGSPADLMNYLVRLEKGSSLDPKHAFLDRAWHAMRTLQAHRALSDLKE